MSVLQNSVATIGQAQLCLSQLRVFQINPEPGYGACRFSTWRAIAQYVMRSYFSLGPLKNLRYVLHLLHHKRPAAGVFRQFRNLVASVDCVSLIQSANGKNSHVVKRGVLDGFSKPDRARVIDAVRQKDDDTARAGNGFENSVR